MHKSFFNSFDTPDLKRGLFCNLTKKRSSHTKTGWLIGSTAQRWGNRRTLEICTKIESSKKSSGPHPSGSKIWYSSILSTVYQSSIFNFIVLFCKLFINHPFQKYQCSCAFIDVLAKPTVFRVFYHKLVKISCFPWFSSIVPSDLVKIWLETCYVLLCSSQNWWKSIVFLDFHHFCCSNLRFW